MPSCPPNPSAWIFGNSLQRRPPPPPHPTVPRWVRRPSEPILGQSKVNWEGTIRPKHICSQPSSGPGPRFELHYRKRANATHGTNRKTQTQHTEPIEKNANARHGANRKHANTPHGTSRKTQPQHTVPTEETQTQHTEPTEQCKHPMKKAFFTCFPQANASQQKLLL